MNPQRLLEPARLTLFQGVDAGRVTDILAECPRLSLGAGDMLLEPGRENHALYLLLDGELRVSLTRDTAQSFTIAVGDCLGEMSIIDGQLPSAFVFAGSAAQVLVIPEAVFWQRLAPLPGVVRNLLRLLTGRMRERNEVMARAQAQQLKYEHLQRELAHAGAIQSAMLPNRPVLFPDHPQVDVHAVMRPAKLVGGDLYDAFPLDDEHILVAVGDVSGKGMPAALFMMRTLTLLRTRAPREPLEALMPALNQALMENNDADMFVTLCVAVLSVRTGRLTLMNGGHNPPLLVRRGEVRSAGKDARGALLGVMPQVRFRPGEEWLEPGDCLMFFTDGLTEAENPAQDLLGLAPVTACLAGGSFPDMACMVQALSSLVEQHAGEADPSDDITLLALRYLGPEAGEGRTGAAPRVS